MIVAFSIVLSHQNAKDQSIQDVLDKTFAPKKKEKNVTGNLQDTNTIIMHIKDNYIVACGSNLFKSIP